MNKLIFAGLVALTLSLGGCYKEPMTIIEQKDAEWGMFYLRKAEPQTLVYYKDGDMLLVRGKSEDGSNMLFVVQLRYSDTANGYHPHYFSLNLVDPDTCGWPCRGILKFIGQNSSEYQVARNDFMDKMGMMPKE